MKIIKNFLLIGVFLFILFVVFSPIIGRSDIYLSSEDKKYFLSLVKENNKKAIENMVRYYKKKKEKRNLYYLRCFLSSQNYIKNFDTKECPSDALTLIEDNKKVYYYLEYKLSPLLQQGTVFLVRDKNDIGYDIE